VADDRNAVRGQIEHLDRDDAEDDRYERGGHDGRNPPQTEDDEERRDPNQKRPSVRVAEMLRKIPELLEEVALSPLDAEQFRELAGDDRERKTDDEPFRTGSEMKFATNPSRSRHASNARTPVLSARVAVSAAKALPPDGN
jgi:hypothetical protein